MTQAEHRFPCDQCGSDLRFEPQSGELRCDHCGHREALELRRSDEIAELSYAKGLRADLEASEMEETRVSSCPNCAAQVEFDPDLHAAECPFCATPVVTGTGAHRHIKPKAVLPFVIAERAARTAMTDWLGSLWFAPNGLQQYARKGRKLDGIYVPYWTYDADTKTVYSGERGTNYTTTKTVRREGKTKRVTVVKTRWKSVRGRVARAFDDVLVLASTSLPRSHTESLAPWDLSQLAPYTPEYLAGFRAEGYQIALEDGFARASEIMERQIRRDIRFDIGGDKQRVHTAETQVSDVTFKHVLLPVWIAAYKYRGRSYRFVVNGQTGSVKGERPYSFFKIAFAVVCMAILVILGVVLGLYLDTLQPARPI